MSRERVDWGSWQKIVKRADLSAPVSPFAEVDFGRIPPNLDDLLKMAKRGVLKGAGCLA